MGCWLVENDDTSWGPDEQGGQQKGFLSAGPRERERLLVAGLSPDPPVDICWA